MNQIKLSVIIVNYQSWGVLESCLRSFKKHPPLASYEIIVIDNDSNDGKLESFSKGHEEIILIKNKGNFGFSNGCNLGASNSKGKYLLFLNPDTELTKDPAIDSMLKYLADYPNTGVVSCRNISETGNGKEDRFLSPWLMFGFLRFIYKKINKEKLARQYPKESSTCFPEWVTGSVVLIENNLFRSVHGWNQERYWMYSEDPDLCFKVARLGKDIVLLRDMTIKHIGGGSSFPSLESSIRYKTEEFISKHNYVQENSKGISRTTLHLMLFLRLQLSVVAIALLLLFLQKRKLTIKIKTFLNCWQYYIHSFKNRTWRNPKLIGSTQNVL